MVVWIVVLKAHRSTRLVGNLITDQGGRIMYVRASLSASLSLYTREFWTGFNANSTPSARWCLNSWSKVSGCHIGVSYVSIRIVIIEQITEILSNTRDELLSLINPSLAYVYCSTTLSNRELIRLKKFVSQISHNLYN